VGRPMHSESIEQLIRERLEEGSELRREFARIAGTRIAEAAVGLKECLGGGGKVLTFGNGGSAADAQHLATELVGRFGKDRLPLAAIALTTDSSALTAIGNDYGFDEVFARQVRALADEGDLVIAISTSGRSPNVINGVKAARAAGVSTIALTGGDGGALAALVDTSIVVPSPNPARVQEVHVATIHILSEVIESLLFPNDGTVMDVPKGVRDWNDLLVLRDRWKVEGRLVVWANGCFDVLHIGHVYLLEQAKQMGDVLVVGVNTDAAVRELKGPGRPIFPLGDRMRLLAGLKATDYVVAFEGTTPERAIADLKPDVHVKGEDYAPATGKPMPERGLVESYGGKVELVPLVPERSTSAVIHRLLQHQRREDE
jgi:phosphoheptose isomerase